jgi:hypothetical protein
MRVQDSCTALFLSQAVPPWKLFSLVLTFTSSTTFTIRLGIPELRDTKAGFTAHVTVLQLSILTLRFNGHMDGHWQRG